MRGGSAAAEQISILRVAAGHVAENLVANDALGDRGEILDERRVELLEFRPQDAVEECSRRLHHDRLPPHSRIAVGAQPIAPAERDQELARPRIGHAEPQLDRDLPGDELGEPLADAGGRSSGGRAFAGRAGAGEQRLDLAQLGAQYVLVQCHAESRALDRLAVPSEKRKIKRWGPL